MVLDTDTYNEIDDQFAVCHCVLNPDRVELQAITAAPFLNDRATSPAEGMEKSYEEIFRLLDRLKHPTDGLVFRGATDYLPDRQTPVESAAVDRIIELAFAQEEPLYVVAIGAITNVASAILKAPEICDRIVLVWLGGQPLFWSSAHEFNLQQDVPAAQVVFDSGVPMIWVPCMTVASHMLATLPQIEHALKGTSAIGDYLASEFKSYLEKSPYYYHPGLYKEIWDVAATAWVVNPDALTTQLIGSPILTDDLKWETGSDRPIIRAATFASVNGVMPGLLKQIAEHQG